MYNPDKIEEIIGRKETNGQYQYLIKWKLTLNRRPSWEPIERLQKIKNLIEEYNSFYEEKEKENTKVINLIEEETSNEENKVENHEIKNKEILNNGGVNHYKNMNNKIIAHFYRVDKSIKKILAVKKENGILYALVEMSNNNGGIKRKKIEAKSLKTNNPWILIDFYESRAKFC